MSIRDIETRIAPIRKQLLNHSLYGKINSPKEVRIFMQHHVYAVWDFMSLLKSLQVQLTCTSLPWHPVGNPEARYLINEILLAEETDINQNGQRQSHYEMYLEAMQQAGIEPTQIRHLVRRASLGTDIYLLITTSDLPISVKKFLNFTFSTIDQKKTHCTAAAFTFGRENLIAPLFKSIISTVGENFPEEDLSVFKYYFDRHTELDTDKYEPMALKMIESLCGESEEKWREAEETALESLEYRLELWDGIEAEIDEIDK